MSLSSLVDRFSYSVMKGIFLNEEEGLFLKFHFNPNELTITKETEYSEQDLNLFPTKLLFWAGGGAKKISFSLFFDTTDYGYVTSSPIRKSLGVLGIEAVLESFLHPSTQRPSPGLSKNYSNFVKDQITGITSNVSSVITSGFSGEALGKLKDTFIGPLESSFKSVKSEIDGGKGDDTKSYTTRTPPDLIFIFGRRWFRCKLMSAPFKESNFNRFLTPRQLNVDVELHVLEEGDFATLLTSQRNRWAKMESDISKLDLAQSLAESAISFAADVAGGGGVLESASTLLELPMDLSL